MLPDFPRVKKILLDWAGAELHRLVLQEPILRQIPQAVHFEGDGMLTHPSSGVPREDTYKRLTTGPIEIPRSAIIAEGPSAFFSQLYDMAEKLKAQQVRLLLELAGETASSVGNVVGTPGKPMTGDLFLDALEKVRVVFDDAGNPQLPQAIVSPQMGEYIRAHAAEWEANPNFRARHARIIEQKRQEWDDQERNRELVD